MNKRQSVSAGPGALHGLSRAWWSRSPLAIALWPLSLLFGLLATLRRAVYRTGLRRTHSLPVPVIVVGNLIAGGAGKTPTVIALVNLLRSRGWHPGIISRGYGGSQEGVIEATPDSDARLCGDEPLLLRLRSGAPTVVGRDRVAAGHALLSRHPDIDVIVSDDGLQHLRLARTAQVVVFDERGIGNGWLLPAGPLREPLTNAVPPRTLVIYNAAQATTHWPGHVARRRLAGAVALADWWGGAVATSQALSALSTRPLFAAAGMASPQRFFDMLRQAGLSITPLPLPDHFAFEVLPWPAGASDVVVTEKDAVKLRPERIDRTRVWVAPLDFELDEAAERDLLGLLPSPPSRTLHGQPIA